MNTREAGQKLGGYSKFTIIRLIEAGKLEAIRVKPGGQYRITDDALQRCKELLTIKTVAFGKPKHAR